MAAQWKKVHMKKTYPYSTPSMALTTMYLPVYTYKGGWLHVPAQWQLPGTWEVGSVYSSSNLSIAYLEVYIPDLFDLQHMQS